MTRPGANWQDEANNPEEFGRKSFRRHRQAEAHNDKLRRRLNHLSLWKSFKEWNRGKAVLRWNDHPTVQMILYRRDQIEALQDDLGAMREDRKAIHDPEQKAALSTAIGSTTKLIEQHVRAIEDLLAKLMTLLQDVDKNRTRLLTNVAQLEQKDRHHKDTLSLRRKDDPSQMSDAELEKLANAGITQEARTIEPDTGDGSGDP